MSTTYRHRDRPDLTVTHPEGYPFDNWTISVLDWSAIFNYLVENDVKRVLEFGSGLSSLLISQVCHLVTLEDNQEYFQKTLKFASKANQMEIHEWDGVHFPDHLRVKYDLVFIDGPEPDRKASFITGQSLSDHVLVHDGFRPAEMALQIRYLSPNFNLTHVVESDYGRVTNLWTRSHKIWVPGA